MALFIARAIKAGVHAHRDASNPDGPPSEVTRAMRRPKATFIYDPVYDLVMNIERKVRGDKQVTPLERPLPRLPAPPLPDHMIASSSSAPPTPTGLTSTRPVFHSPYPEARSTPASRSNLILDRHLLDRDLPPLPGTTHDGEDVGINLPAPAHPSAPPTPVPPLPPRQLTRAPSRDTLDEPPPPYPGHEIEGFQPEPIGARQSSREARRQLMTVANPDE